MTYRRNKREDVVMEEETGRTGRLVAVGNDDDNDGDEDGNEMGYRPSLFVRQCERRRLIKSCIGGMAALALFLAMDYYAATAMQQSVPSASSTTTTTLRRRLEDEPSWGEIVQDIIEENMANGEYGKNDSRIANITYIPIEDIEDAPSRDIDQPDNDSDGLDRIWIIVMCVVGGVVLCMICIAYACLRKAEREVDDGEEGEDEESDANNAAVAKTDVRTANEDEEDDNSNIEQQEQYPEE